MFYWPMKVCKNDQYLTSQILCGKEIYATEGRRKILDTGPTWDST